MKDSNTIYNSGEEFVKLLAEIGIKSTSYSPRTSDLVQYLNLSSVHQIRTKFQTIKAKIRKLYPDIYQISNLREYLAEKFPEMLEYDPYTALLSVTLSNALDRGKLCTGLGDTLHFTLNKIPMEAALTKAAKLLGLSNCGCRSRRLTLNRLFPYKEVK